MAVEFQGTWSYSVPICRDGSRTRTRIRSIKTEYEYEKEYEYEASSYFL
jgi:hypothetical protein